jgi:PAS domain S-box-containing protein
MNLLKRVRSDLYYLLAFIVMCGTVCFFTEQNLQTKIEYAEYSHLHHLQVNYEIWASNQADEADIIYKHTVEKPGVLELIQKAWQTTDSAQRSALRNRLQTLLASEYEEYKRHGLLQYHFIFPDNTCFLRMHKTTKFGDDLTTVRPDVDKVNRNHEIVRGFSQGRTAHAIRNVYPLTAPDGTHIGVIEISYPTEHLQQPINNINEIHTHFLVKESIFKTKAWKRDDRVMQYHPSVENSDYMLTHTESNIMQHKEEISKFLDPHRELIKKKMKEDNLFSLVAEHDDKFLLLSFYPIFQNATFELSAWLVSYTEDPYIEAAVSDTLYARVSSFIVIFTLLLFVRMIMRQKRKLGDLVESYDKNVIFSTTDLYGRITHVSTAFCEISGYTREELLSKPHNIIRHPDMPRKAFENMWDTIQSGKVWKGEVKNLKKDGGFYWVDAEITPIRNESGKTIGYSAIRHDITPTKEIENVQKEIIFTMGSIGESRSKETANHVKRVAGYTRLLAELTGMDEKEVSMLEEASPMHDIGKVAIPDNILNKPAKLDADEWKVMQTHAQQGYEMLKHSNRPLMVTAAIIALQHHEKYDGTGYPSGLKGESIHIYGRITALADVYDALISERSYKPAWDEPEVLKLILDERGKHFDPELVDLFLHHYGEFKAIKERYADE